jgi:hypothetical protein
VRLAHKIIDSLRMELEAVRYFTDSSAVLGMLNKDSASFLEFVGTRVSEIRIKSNPDKEWFWIPGELNLADQGTRPTVLPRDMAPGTPYQDGLPWMRDPVETLPVKKKFATPPVEECRKEVLNVAGGLSAMPKLVYPARATTRAKLERIFGYVFTAVARLKKLPAFSPVEVRAEGQAKKGPWTEYGPPAEKYRTAARQFLLQDAQAGLDEKQMESLMVEKKIQAEEDFPKRAIIMVEGRQKKHLWIAHNLDELRVLPPDHELGRLYLQEAHELDHAGVDAMIMRSRSCVWIIRIRPKAQAVKNACFTCRRRTKELGIQKMAPLSDHRMGPTPPFWSTAVDLFGPLSVVGTVNKRTTMKTWGVILHSDITGARGNSRVILNGSIPAGAEEVHGAARGPQAIPVGSGNATGCGLKTSEDLGLVESAPTSGERRGRMARGPNRRLALQRSGRTNDRHTQKMPGGSANRKEVHNGGDGHANGRGRADG